MALRIKSFDTENTVVIVNGRSLNDWGTTDPITESYTNAKRTVKQGLGGNAVVLERINQLLEVRLRLLPGGDDSAFLSGLFNSGSTISYARKQVGALETTISLEGVIVNMGDCTRAGADDISDDEYVIHFNGADTQKG